MTVVSDATSEQVSRFPDGGDHLLAGDGVVGTVVFHSAFKVSRHHADGYRIVVLAALVVAYVPVVGLAVQWLMPFHRHFLFNSTLAVH